MKLSLYLWRKGSTVLLDFQDEIKVFKLWGLLHPTACDPEINVSAPQEGPQWKMYRYILYKSFYLYCVKRSVWDTAGTMEGGRLHV